MTGCRTRPARGNATIEMAVITPVMAMLLVGMVQFAEITYTYYTLRKIVYSIATYVNTRQGVDFCSGADAQIMAAINLAITGTPDGSQPSQVIGLTSSMIQVSAEDASSSAWCSDTPSQLPPAYVIVSIPDGYPFQIVIPFFTVFDPISLMPEVKLPYAGT